MAPTGELIWGDILPVEMPWLFGRMRRNITVQISANPQADFAYFPVMAGDDLSEIVNLLVGCSRV
jgi:hypothetical protein